MHRSIALFAIFTIATPLVSAVGCTQDQKQQMLDTITKSPQWPACQQATAPFDFFLALTQEGPTPTPNDLTKFKGNAACTTVYSSFQDAIKQANCDEVADLVGISVDQLVSATAATTTAAPPVATQITTTVSSSVAPVGAAATMKPTTPVTTLTALDTTTGKLQPSLAAASASIAISAMSLAVVAML